MSEHRWNIGDEVCIRRVGYLSVDFTFGRVERVTKTQVIAMGGQRFNARTGYKVGKSDNRFYGARRIEPVTDEIRAEFKEAKAQKDAERKCREWARKLDQARGDNAIRLAALLPEAPE